MSVQDLSTPETDLKMPQYLFKMCNYGKLFIDRNVVLIHIIFSLFSYLYDKTHQDYLFF